MINLLKNLIYCLNYMVLAVLPFEFAWAQSLNFGDGNGRPIEIFADNGVEWRQNTLVFIARGNARAVRTDVTVFADELRAYYRKNKIGGTDIWRLDALGKVRIKTPQSNTYGEKAIYNVDKAILVVSGGKVKLITKTDTITASRQIEYWEHKKMAVARGGAKAIREDKKLKADTLVAYFMNNNQGKSTIDRIEAFENVKIDTQKDTAFSNRGVYNVKSGIATLVGSVKIIRDGNTIKGCSADVNLNTGISHMHSCQNTQGSGKTRVEGVLLPNQNSLRGNRNKKTN